MALAVPILAALSWWSFVSPTNPSPTLGYVVAVGACAAVLLQVHFASYRVDANPEGITETWLWGRRQVGWDDVQKVECIAQAGNGRTIQRWSSSPEEAFHIVVHTRRGRISVHRWMSGVDDLVAALGADRAAQPYRQKRESVLERDDPTVKPLLGPSTARDVANRVYDGLVLFKVVALVLPLSWIGGLMVSLHAGLTVSGSPFVDATLVGMIPWAIGLGIYKILERVRGARFGRAHARPPLGAKDAILAMAAGMAGPTLLVWVLPRVASGAAATVDYVLAAMGLLFCWVPVAEVRRCLQPPG